MLFKVAANLDTICRKICALPERRYGETSPTPQGARQMHRISRIGSGKGHRAWKAAAAAARFSRAALPGQPPIDEHGIVPLMRAVPGFLGAGNRCRTRDSH